MKKIGDAANLFLLKPATVGFLDHEHHMKRLADDPVVEMRAPARACQQSEFKGLAAITPTLSEQQ
jgi:hypothetical protein